MTAEIGIGNQGGIVLAADSAVSETDYSGRVQAIYDSAQKLYTLGWQHYVGLLLYGNASFEGTPWSVLFDHFKRQVGSERLPHIDDYQATFFKYLCAEHLVDLPVTDQRSTVYQVADSLAYTLCQDFQGGNRNSDELASFIQGELNTIAQNYLQANNGQFAVDNYSEDQFADEYAAQLFQLDPNQPEREGLVVKLMKARAQQINIDLNGDNNYHNLFFDQMTGLWLKALYIILFCGLSSGQWKGIASSGVVIAGYGSQDDWPVLKQLNIYGCVGQHPIYTVADVQQVGQVNQNGDIQRSLFLPLAQTDVADTLQLGISSDIYSELEDTLMNKTDLPNETKQQIFRQINNYFYVNYVGPFTSEIAMLNIPELAEIAETMIKVTSFERQYNGDHYATVGGPIDILAITPNDGPVWIRKKHYFDPNTRDNLGRQLRLQRGK
ncbi:MAG: hypothetical protein ACI4UB_06195 [Limosilactobacillus sp.]